MFQLTGGPEEASAQLIAHLRKRGMWPEETLGGRIAELDRQLSEVRDELMKKKKHGSEHSGGIRTEEQRHQEGGGWSGDSHGNAQDGGGRTQTDAQ